MTKIAWLSDFKSFGGGEETQNILIEKCPKDIEIDQIFGGKLTKDDYDLYIIGSLRLLTKLQIEFLISKKKYIVCWRDVINTPHDDSLAKLFTNALTNIFLSQLHQQSFFKKFNIYNWSWNCIPPYFDVFQYESPEMDKRSYDICWVGDIQYHKGIENVLLWARKNKKVIDFYGRGHPTIVNQLQQSNYAKYLGYIKDIKYIYPQYKNFIHLPDSVEAFGRCCMEAYLSGCNMIVDEKKIGMYSYFEIKNNLIKNNDKIKNWFDDSVDQFWKTIKTYLV